MSIIKRSGTTYNGFPAFFNNLVTKDIWNWDMDNNSPTNTTIPAVNIRETSDNFLVEMAAPGLKKEDFKVELNGNSLTITSEKVEEEAKEEERFTRKEFSYQSFLRIFTLPKEVVDAEKIEARYENGLLSLVIPKKEEVKQKGPRLIQIS